MPDKMIPPLLWDDSLCGTYSECPAVGGTPTVVGICKEVVG